MSYSKDELDLLFEGAIRARPDELDAGYIGRGASGVVFADPDDPGRVLKITRGPKMSLTPKSMR